MAISGAVSAVVAAPSAVVPYVASPFASALTSPVPALVGSLIGAGSGMGASIAPAGGAMVLYDSSVKVASPDAVKPAPEYASGSAALSDEELLALVTHQAFVGATMAEVAPTVKQLNFLRYLKVEERLVRAVKTSTQASTLIEAGKLARDRARGVAPM